MQEGPSKRLNRVGRVVSAFHRLSAGYLYILGGESPLVTNTHTFPVLYRSPSEKQGLFQVWGGHILIASPLPQNPQGTG